MKTVFMSNSFICKKIIWMFIFASVTPTGHDGCIFSNVTRDWRNHFLFALSGYLLVCVPLAALAIWRRYIHWCLYNYFFVLNHFICLYFLQHELLLESLLLMISIDLIIKMQALSTSYGLKLFFILKYSALWWNWFVAEFIWKLLTLSWIFDAFKIIHN